MGYYRGDYYRGDYYMGDPFSFSGLLKGIGGLGIPGISTLANVAGSLLGGSSGATTAGITPALPPPLPPTFPGIGGGGFTGIQGQAGSLGFAIGTGTPGFSNIAAPGPVGGPAVQPGVSITPSGAVVPCQLKGYHANKSTYVRRKGGLQLVPKGSVCVKNRHRNPTNGKALRRALSRAYAFKNIAMKTLHLVAPRKRHVFGGFKRRKKA